MGHSRKGEIERLRRERREAKAAGKRKEATRERFVRFLIVCEGEKTEPHYFESLVKNHISTVREVKIEGEGKATVALVNATFGIKKELERRNNMAFDRVWVVFDKDDFDDFNEAINAAERLGFRCAWSNEAFELWYCLHFDYLDTGISRAAYIDKLEKTIRKKMNDSGFRYEKGSPENYNLLMTYGDERLAKRFAEKLRSQYRGKDYAAHKPCTTVDLLVEELENPEKLLDGE